MSIANFKRFFTEPGRLPADFPFSPVASGKLYLKSLLCYLVGTLIPFAIFYALLQYALTDSPSLADFMFAQDNFLVVIAVVSVITFLSGFGAQFLYVRVQLLKQGYSLLDVIALNRKYFSGTRLQLIACGLATFALAIGLEQVFAAVWPSEIKDKTADMISGMHGLSFALMALLAVFAPIFEEIIFRGFVYGSIRSALHKRLPASDCHGYRRQVILFDLSAAFFSALMFGLAHLNLSALPVYIILGMVFAEAYRRTGSLYVPMIGHFVNNGVLMLLLMFSH